MSTKYYNDDYYPTPLRLINKMIGKINGSPRMILEPSAGSGSIIEALKERRKVDKIYAIESDPELRAMLMGKKIDLLDSDFLDYAGTDKFSLIIGNPPFATGDIHLLKAIDILYRGQIIFLLNADTLRNPYTVTRKTLVSKLSSLGAEIEYLPGEFRNAERPTGVEVALINIIIDRKVEDDLFADCSDSIHGKAPEVSGECRDVATRRGIEDLVAEYNEVVRLGTETIIAYYRNYRKIGGFIHLSCRDKEERYERGDDLTGKLQDKLNDLLDNVRTTYWRKALNLKEIKSRLTAKRQAEFEEQLNQNSRMDFTERNLRQFVLNFVGDYFSGGSRPQPLDHPGAEIGFNGFGFGGQNFHVTGHMKLHPVFLVFLPLPFGLYLIADGDMRQVAGQGDKSGLDPFADLHGRNGKACIFCAKNDPLDNPLQRFMCMCCIHQPVFPFLVSVFLK